MDTLMQATLRVRELGGSTNQLRAVAAYEDSSTDARVCEMWLLSELRVPRLRSIAAQDAAEAQVLIISVHHCEELPAELQSWLELWLARKKSGPTLLLALLDPVYLGVSATLRTYLETIAHKAHAEFLVQSEDGVSYA